MTDDKLDPAADWFDCLGNTVPKSRRNEALKEIENMGVKVDDSVRDAVNDTANHIQADRPRKAIGRIRGVVDLAGVYRVLAVLCCGGKNE